MSTAMISQLMATIHGADDHHPGEQHHDQPCEQPPVHAAEKKYAHGDHRDHRERTEVRLAQQQPAGEQHHPEHRQEARGFAFVTAMRG